MRVNMNNNFVLFTTNRSGSEWVMSTLNNYEDVVSQSELFLPRSRSAEDKWYSDFSFPRFVEIRNRPGRIRPFTVFSYLDALYGVPGKVGFKLMYKQLGLYPEMLYYLMKHRIRVVHLVRKNHLDVMLSYAVKARIGQSHLMAGQAAPSELRVELETRNLLRKLRWLEGQQNMARRLLKLCKLQYLEIAYEDLVRDPDQFHVIANFLSVNSRQQVPQSVLSKIRKVGHRDVIDNYDQVRAVLANSKFAALLE